VEKSKNKVCIDGPYGGNMTFHENILKIDSESEIDKICEFIEKQVATMKRDGAIIGLSGGVDSAVSAALCVKALGTTKVTALILPEKESNPISEEYAKKQAMSIGLDTITEDITGTLEGFGTYERRDKVIKQIFPEFTKGYQSKLTLPPDLLNRDSFNFYLLNIKDSEGKVKTARLNNQNVRQILAASNSKQITRMMYLNYYAERLNYVVCGTTNRSEYLQGFFVKYGDGGVDIEPIEHLYKMQVYQLATRLEIIPEIIKRAPSPDTFTFEVTDEEMHFRIPYEKLDPILYAWENQIDAAEVSQVMHLNKDQITRAFRDITSKHKATYYLRMPPQTLK
jgi:NAD+ synthase